MSHRRALWVALAALAILCGPVAGSNPPRVLVWPTQCDSSLQEGCNTFDAIPCAWRAKEPITTSSNDAFYFPTTCNGTTTAARASVSYIGSVPMLKRTVALPKSIFPPNFVFKFALKMLGDPPTYPFSLGLSSRVPANINLTVHSLSFTPSTFNFEYTITATVTASTNVRPYLRFTINQTHPTTCDMLCLRLLDTPPSTLSLPSSTPGNALSSPAAGSQGAATTGAAASVTTGAAASATTGAAASVTTGAAASATTGAAATATTGAAATATTGAAASVTTGAAATAKTGAATTGHASATTGVGASLTTGAANSGAGAAATATTGAGAGATIGAGTKGGAAGSTVQATNSPTTTKAAAPVTPTVPPPPVTVVPRGYTFIAGLSPAEFLASPSTVTAFKEAVAERLNITADAVIVTGAGLDVNHPEFTAIEFYVEGADDADSRAKTQSAVSALVLSPPDIPNVIVIGVRGIATIDVYSKDDMSLWPAIAFPTIVGGIIIVVVAYFMGVRYHRKKVLVVPATLPKPATAPAASPPPVRPQSAPRAAPAPATVAVPDVPTLPGTVAGDAEVLAIEAPETTHV